jgi:uncharacterized protein YjiS (DUF1127 family)
MPLAPPASCAGVRDGFSNRRPHMSNNAIGLFWPECSGNSFRLQPPIGPLFAVLDGFRRAGATALEWRRRAHERRQLAAMDARLMRDLGLTTLDVWSEVNKPFWRP